MVHTQPRIHPRKRDVYNSQEFWDINGISNLGQTTRPRDNQQKRKRKEKKKRTCRIVDFAIPVDLRVKLKEIKEISTWILWENRRKTNQKNPNKLWNMGMLDTNSNWCVRYSYQRIGIKTRGLGNKRTNGDNSIVEISQNTDKSLGDFRRFTVTQTPVKNYQLTLMWITLRKHEGGLFTAIRNDTDNTMDNRMTTRKQKWEEKQLHGRFKRLINNISHYKTWTRLRKGNFKRETESLLIAAQNKEPIILKWQ